MDGVINIYKPAGITSFDVVRKVKKVCGIKKVGHTGTLDPLATGVLPVCVGKATKIVDYIMNDFKIYNAVLKLGEVTDTYDKEGKILSSSPVKVSEEEIKKAVFSFEGEINQVPPMYSALKVNGKKLYELARQGIEIERKERQITIYKIDIVSIESPFVSIKVKCSKGTYIRSLCYDIGNYLSCGAYMWSLERESTGSFKKENSIMLDELSSENIDKFILPLDKALDMYEKITVLNSMEKLLINGAEIGDPRLIPPINEGEIKRVYLENGNFIGIGLRLNNKFKITKLLI